MRKDHLRWYKDLYLSPHISKRKAARYKRALNKKFFLADFYIIAVSLTDTDQLEFFSAKQLMQRHMPEMGYSIVGLALTHEDALLLVEAIVNDVYSKTGEANLKEYFLSRMDSDK